MPMAKRRPPDRQPCCSPTGARVVKDFAHPRLFLAGKSMGGRMAAELYQDGGDEMDAAGFDRSRYPFHPGQPRPLAREVLKQITTPTLLLQGERDTFWQPRAELADSFIRRIGPLADRRGSWFQAEKGERSGDQDNLREAAERSGPLSPTWILAHA